MKIPGADEAMEHLAAWAVRKRWQQDFLESTFEHLDPPCSAFEVGDMEFIDLIGEEHAVNIHSWVFEDIVASRLGPKARNIIDDYLDQRGYREPIPARDYLAALRDSTPSLYEVVAVKPGISLTLRDLIRGGEPVEVHDELASETVVEADRLGVRILSVGGRSCLSTAILQFPEETAQTMLRVLLGTTDDAKRALAENISLADDEESFADQVLATRPLDLRLAGRFFTWIWLSYTLGRMRQPPPRMVNFEGDEVVFTTLRYTIGSNPRLREEISGRLDAAPSLVCNEEQISWSWTEPFDDRGEIDMGKGMPLIQRHENGELQLGTLEFGERDLILHVNSAARADRGRKMLKEVLDGLLGEPAVETKSVADMMSETSDDPEGGEGESLEEEPEPLSTEQARALREVADQHYRKVIDEKVPMLMNHTPRELAAAPETRPLVVAWLKFLENSEAHRARESGSFPYDFSWMWRALGLEDLRR